MVEQQGQGRKGGLSFENAAVIVATSLLGIGFVLYVWMEWASHSMFYALPVTAGFAAFFALPALLLLWRAAAAETGAGQYVLVVDLGCP